MGNSHGLSSHANETPKLVGGARILKPKNFNSSKEYLLLVIEKDKHPRVATVRDKSGKEHRLFLRHDKIIMKHGGDAGREQIKEVPRALLPPNQNLLPVKNMEEGPSDDDVAEAYNGHAAQFGDENDASNYGENDDRAYNDDNSSYGDEAAYSDNGYGSGGGGGGDGSGDDGSDDGGGDDDDDGDGGGDDDDHDDDKSKSYFLK